MPAFQVFSRAFESGQVGSAAAIGITLTAIIFVISFGINRVGGAGSVVTSRTEQTLGYVILGVFSLIALLPIVGILLTALQDPDGGRDVRLLRRRALLRTSRPRGRTGTSART